MTKATLIKIGKSRTEARKIASQVSISELNAVINNLQAAKQFLAKQSAKKSSAQKTKQIKKAMSMLNQMGLKPEDLSRAKKGGAKTNKKTSAKRKVAAKYRITVKGVVTEWSGRGRMPVVFREVLGKNGSLDRYLIK
ncbi:MAG: H-NS histone family protein [Luminiphilus sp.]|jgi:DNA-binding protein H-NS|nr:H-NS histone family protein [Luminiphilus sp.]